MTRTFVVRLVSVLALALGLSLSLLGGNASAQIARGPAEPAPPASSAAAVPGVGGQVRTEPGPAVNGNAQVGVTPYAWQCGFYRDRDRGWDAMYTHCGNSAFPRIRVEFNYGWGGTRDITVLGTANLSRHRDLQGAGAITNAWCVRDCW